MRISNRKVFRVKKPIFTYNKIVLTFVLAFLVSAGSIFAGNAPEAHAVSVVATPTAERATIPLTRPEPTGFIVGWGSNQWGQNGNGQTGTAWNTPRQAFGTPGTRQNWVSVHAGHAHSFAINELGHLYAWGQNHFGPLGLGTSGNNSFTLQRVGTASNWVTVSGGQIHTMALNEDGELFVWGSNSWGQLGIPALSPGWAGVGADYLHTPTQITSPNRVWVDISASLNTSAAITADGHLYMWGQDSSLGGFGVAGEEITYPTRVGTEDNWSKVSVGAHFAIILNEDGELFAIGHNTWGQTGLGTDALFSIVNTPTRIGDADNWVDIRVSNVNFSLALNEVGEIWAWGSNFQGQTGQGTDVGNTSTPQQVGTASNWRAMAAGTTHGLAIDDQGRVHAWGSNAHQRLGLGPGFPAGNTTDGMLLPHPIIRPVSPWGNLFDNGVHGNWIAVAAGDNHSLGIVFDDRDDRTLEVTKEVAGQFANRTALFNFTMTLWAASTPMPTPLTGIITDSDGNPVPAPRGVVNIAGGMTRNASFQLMHGETLTIEDLPPGVTWTVTEQPHPEFMPSVTVYVGGSVETTASAGFNSPLPTGTHSLSDEGRNAADFVNRQEVAPPTGLFINRVPYGLAVTAVLLLGVYFAFKARGRRKEYRVQRF